MASTLATRQDLDSQVLLLRHDLESGFALVHQKLDTLRNDVGKDIQTTGSRIDALRVDLGKDIQTLDARVDTLRNDFVKDLKLQSMQQTIRTGLMIYSAVALLFAAQKLLP